MAGIGFELEKLFHEKGTLKGIKAYAFSAWVTAGPPLMCIGLFVWLKMAMRQYGVSELQKQLITGSVVYGFLISQLVTSGMGMVVTRFVADQIWMKKYNKVLASFYGVCSFCLFIGSLIGFLFYRQQHVSTLFKLMAYGFMMEMIVVWLEGIYLSTMKEIKYIVRAYLIGIGITIAGFYLLMLTGRISGEVAALAALCIGFLCHITYNMAHIRAYLKTDDESKADCFEFLAYIEEYPALFWINFFYVLALYCHNVIYWYSSYGMSVSNTYYFAPFYDIPVFLAFLAYIPNAVYFVVRTETYFYIQYENYYRVVREQGSYSVIQGAKKEMIKSTWNEVRNAAEIQLIVTIIWGIAGYLAADFTGLSSNGLEIYFIVVMGTFFGAMDYVLMLLLMYFDDRKGALFVTSVFLVFNLSLTALNLIFELGWHGFGYFFAASAACFIGTARLDHYLKNIDYYTFCTQAVIPGRPRGIIAGWRYRKNERQMRASEENVDI